MSMRDTEVSRDFQERQFQESIRQFNEQQSAARAAASAAAASAGYGFGGGGGEPTAPSPSQNGLARMDRAQSGDFNFTDKTGKPINALQFSQLRSKGYREVLSEMAKAGDKNAKLALKYVGNDGKFGSAPAQYKSALSAVGATGSYVSPALQRATNYSLSNMSISRMK